MGYAWQSSYDDAFKGYPFYLIHDGHVKVSRPFNVGGYRAHYKFKELAYNERMVYLENLLNGIVDVNDVNIFLLEYFK